jgi:hypothetical protein
MKGFALTAAAIAGLAGMGQATRAIPDHLSVDRSHPMFSPIYKELGVRFNGEERQGDVQAYCVSEGWIDVRTRSAKGKFIPQGSGFVVERLYGRVEPYFKREDAAEIAPPDPEGDRLRREAAQAKRDRRAAKLKGKA